MSKKLQAVNDRDPLKIGTFEYRERYLGSLEVRESDPSDDSGLKSRKSGTQDDIKRVVIVREDELRDRSPKFEMVYQNLGMEVCIYSEDNEYEWVLTDVFSARSIVDQLNNPSHPATMYVVSENASMGYALISVDPNTNELLAVVGMSGSKSEIEQIAAMITRRYYQRFPR